MSDRSNGRSTRTNRNHGKHRDKSVKGKGGKKDWKHDSINQNGKKPAWQDIRNATPVNVNRTLFASAMSGDGFTTTLRVLTRREREDVILDRAINLIDLNTIEGFADKAKDYGVEGMTGVILGVTGKVAQQFVIVMNCGVDTLKTSLIEAVRKVYADKHENAVGEILSTLRAIDAPAVVNHGVWNESKVAARRFLASVLCFAFGAEWLETNFSSKPTGYETLAVYQDRTIAANGFEASSTIPTLTPTSQPLVFGIFPQPNGKKEKRYIGVLPMQPMIKVGKPNMILPAFIVVDRNSAAMKQLIQLVELGVMDADTMFKTVNGEYFVYTPEILASMIANQLFFTAMLSIAIASTNGNLPLAKEIKERYDAYARAYPALTSLIAQDYTMTPALPTATATSRTSSPSHVAPVNGSARSNKSATPVLATVGAGSSFDPFASNS